MYALILIIASLGEVKIPAFYNTAELCYNAGEAMYSEHRVAYICANVVEDPLIIGRTIWIQE